MVTRIVQYVLMFFLGVVFGVLGTVAQQSVFRVAGLTIPWGLVLSLLGVTFLLIGLRLVNDGRGIVLVTAIGTVAAIGVLTMKSFGGSVLIPNNLLGQIWVIAPIVVAIIVISWPRVAVRRRPAQ